MYINSIVGQKDRWNRPTIVSLHAWIFLVLVLSSFVFLLNSAITRRNKNCLQLDSFITITEPVQVELKLGVDQRRQDHLPRSSVRQLSSNLGDVLKCRITVDCTYYSNVFGAWTEELILCIPINNSTGEEDDETYPIELPDGIRTMYSQDVMRGNLYITISPAAQIVHGSLVFSEHVVFDAEPIISFNDTYVVHNETLNPPRRLEESKVVSMGHRKVLAIRISTDDSSPTYSTEEYYNYLFGPSTIHSVQSQMFQCSSGKIKFVPILGGVVDVVLNSSIYEFDNRLSVANAALENLKIQWQQDTTGDGAKMVGISNINDVADHVLFCIPPGTGDWVASAVTRHFRTIYNDRNCARLSVVMHEIGHNFGLTHANEGTQKYMDLTGYMGASYASLGSPLKCYNGYNNFVLRWYEDRTLSLTWFNQPRLIHLAAFVDYDLTTEDEPVLINIANHYYIQYNRAKSYNAETGEHVNQVSIIENLGGTTDLIAGLDIHSPLYTITNFGMRVNGVNMGILTINVCDMLFPDSSSSSDQPDKVVLSIAMGYSVCGAYHAMTQRQPTTNISFPTMAPNNQPSSLIFIHDQPEEESSSPSIVPSTLPSTIMPLLDKQVERTDMDDLFPNFNEEEEEEVILWNVEFDSFVIQEDNDKKPLYKATSRGMFSKMSKRSIYMWQ